MGGLSFLNTGLLFFAAAAILPLLIWLLAKKKPKRIVFPTLRFIKAGQEQEKKRTKLKNIILLIIRMLIILLVALAAARPLLQSARLKPSSKHPPTAIAIMLDTTLSMDYVSDGKSNLDRAKEALRKVNSLCGNQDRLVLITTDESWNRLHAQIYAGRIPEDLISRIDVNYTPLTLDKMLSLAEQKIQETQLANTELYYVTDGQKAAMTIKPEQRLNIINVFQSAAWDNLSCSEAGVLPQLTERSRRQTIQFKLTNHGNTEKKDVLVKAVLGDVKVAEMFIALPPRQTVNETIVIDLQQDGWQSGYVEVLDDMLTRDNRAYFAFPYNLTPHIAVISDSGSLPPALGPILKVYAGAAGKVDIIRQQQLDMQILDQYQTFVFDCRTSLSPKIQEIINTLRSRKIGALFCLDKNLSAESKSYLASIFGCSFGNWQNTTKTVNYINPHNYVTELLAGKNIFNGDIFGYWSISGSASTQLLGSGTDKIALAKDNYILWNFDLSNAANGFFLDAAYPVFAYRSLEYVSTALAGGEHYDLGDKVGAYKAVLPDGKEVQPATRSLVLEQPGIYRLQEASGDQKALAVDVPRGESEWQSLNVKQLRNARLLGKEWQKELFRTRLGHDLWKILLVAAMLLFLLEIILVKTEEARPAKQTNNP